MTRPFVADRVAALAARVRDRQEAARLAREAAEAAESARCRVVNEVIGWLQPLVGTPTPHGPLQAAVRLNSRAILFVDRDAGDQLVLADLAPVGRTADCFAYVARWFAPIADAGQVSRTTPEEALQAILDHLEPYLFPEDDES